MSVANVNPDERQLSVQELDNFLITGDLAKLTEGQRVNFYMQMCARANVDPVMKPFDYLVLNNKLVLYCNKNGGDQIAAANIVSRRIISRERDDNQGLVTVIAEASLPNGRFEQATGVVSIKFANGGLYHGDSLANAWMKAETKAKRRAVLAVTGLSLLDDAELESIPGRNMEQAHTAHQITIEAATQTPVDEDELMYMFELVYDPDPEDGDIPYLRFVEANNLDRQSFHDIGLLLQDQLVSHLRNRANSHEELAGMFADLSDEAKDYRLMKAAFNQVRVSLREARTGQ